MNRRGFLIGASTAALAAGAGSLGAVTTVAPQTSNVVFDVARNGDWTAVTHYVKAKSFWRVSAVDGEWKPNDRAIEAAS